MFDKRGKQDSPQSPSFLSTPPSSRLSFPESIHGCSNLHRLHLRNTPLRSIPNSLFQMSRSLYEIDLSPVSALSLPESEDPRLALPLSIPPSIEDYKTPRVNKLSASVPHSLGQSTPSSPLSLSGMGGTQSHPAQSRKNRTRATGGKKIRISSSSSPSSSSSSPSPYLFPASSVPSCGIPQLSALPDPSSQLRSFSSTPVVPINEGISVSDAQTMRRWKGGDVGCAKIIGVEGKNEDRLLVRFGNGVEESEEETDGEEKSPEKSPEKGYENRKESEKDENGKDGEFDWGYFGVFDGHGGKEASTYVANRFHKLFFAELKAVSENIDDWTREVIVDGFKKTFSKITEQMHAHFLSRHIKTMQGTTATVGIVVKGVLYVANVGDSRAVLCWGGEAVRISRDHKPGDEDEMEQVRKTRGLMKPFTKNSKRYRIFQVAARSGGRSVALSRTLGDFHVHPFVVAHPHIVALSLPFLSTSSGPSSSSRTTPPPLSKSAENSSSLFSSFNWGVGLLSSALGLSSAPKLPSSTFLPQETSEDCFLVIASDGLWDVCTDSEVAQIVRYSEDATQGALRLRDHAIHLGSMDDTSVLVVRFEGLKKSSDVDLSEK